MTARVVAVMAYLHQAVETVKLEVLDHFEDNEFGACVHHTIVRGFLLGAVLVCRRVGACNTFVCGGGEMCVCVCVCVCVEERKCMCVCVWEEEGLVKENESFNFRHLVA